MFFKHLSDATRLEIIKQLRKGKKSVSQIADATKFEQSRVSHTLRKLKEAGFVTVKQQGKERVYALERTIEKVLKITDSHVDEYYAHYCQCTGKIRQERWRTSSRRKQV